MSKHFRPRAALCALTAVVLTACGGGGDSALVPAPDDAAILAADARANSVPPQDEISVLVTSTAVEPNNYKFDSAAPPQFQSIGAYQLGYITLSAASGLEMHVGHLKGDKTKFFVSVVQTGTPAYECISKAWTAEEKAAMLAVEGGVVPPACDSGITFNGSTNRFSIVRAPLRSADGKKIVLNVNTTLLPITFP